MTEHRPRKHDHLVEPMFAALDVRGEPHANEAERSKRSRFVRLAIWCLILAAGSVTIWIFVVE